jgi:hypothetical protein
VYEKIRELRQDSSILKIENDVEILEFDEDRREES